MSNTAVAELAALERGELGQLLAYLTPEERAEIEWLLQQYKPPLWQPNPDRNGEPNPQRLAYESPADIVGYGGSAGGGKTDLGLGLAATAHQKSAIFRRVFPSLRGIIERSREIFNPEGADHSKDSYNEQLHRWRLKDGRIIEFEACQYEKDKEKQRGRPRDLYVFDEATEFTRSQVEFISAWNRSIDPHRRCRVVLTFNPPLDETGNWIIDFFLPWLAYLFPKHFHHDNPAAPGELRWYAMVAGEEVACADGTPFMHNGERIIPRSRTFIPARLEHNPWLENTNYRSVIQALPEPLRSQLLYGDFAATAAPNPWQVIPTEWVLLAQRRWRERVRPDTPLTAVGVDVAWGGADQTAISKRYDNWFDEVIRYPGIATPRGTDVAFLVGQSVGDETPLYINIDALSGGKAAYEPLSEMFDCVNAINAGAGSDYRDKSGKYKMRNIRAEYHWRLREALDPENGDDLALPPGKEVIVDLCAATFKPTTAGIQIEEKDSIRERIGRSPDTGEAILLANMPDTRPKPPPEVLPAGIGKTSTWRG